MRKEKLAICHFRRREKDAQVICIDPRDERYLIEAQTWNRGRPGARFTLFLHAYGLRKAAFIWRDYLAKKFHTHIGIYSLYKRNAPSSLSSVAPVARITKTLDPDFEIFDVDIGVPMEFHMLAKSECAILDVLRETYLKISGEKKEDWSAIETNPYVKEFVDVAPRVPASQLSTCIYNTGQLPGFDLLTPDAAIILDVIGSKYDATKTKPAELELGWISVVNLTATDTGDKPTEIEIAKTSLRMQEEEEFPVFLVRCAYSKHVVSAWLDVELELSKLDKSEQEDPALRIPRPTAFLLYALKRDGKRADLARAWKHNVRTDQIAFSVARDMTFFSPADVHYYTWPRIPLSPTTVIRDFFNWVAARFAERGALLRDTQFEPRDLQVRLDEHGDEERLVVPEEWFSKDANEAAAKALLEKWGKAGKAADAAAVKAAPQKTSALAPTPTPKRSRTKKVNIPSAILGHGGAEAPPAAAKKEEQNPPNTTTTEQCLFCSTGIRQSDRAVFVSCSNGCYLPFHSACWRPRKRSGDTKCPGKDCADGILGQQRQLEATSAPPAEPPPPPPPPPPPKLPNPTSKSDDPAPPPPSQKPSLRPAILAKMPSDAEAKALSDRVERSKKTAVPLLNRASLETGDMADAVNTRFRRKKKQQPQQKTLSLDQFNAEAPIQETTRPKIAAAARTAAGAAIPPIVAAEKSAATVQHTKFTVTGLTPRFGLPFFGVLFAGPAPPEIEIRETTLSRKAILRFADARTALAGYNKLNSTSLVEGVVGKVVWNIVWGEI